MSLPPLERVYCELCDSMGPHKIMMSGDHWICRDCAEGPPWTDREFYTLASNLTIAAALCRADRNGADRDQGLHDWRPGCQRSAP